MKVLQEKGDSTRKVADKIGYTKRTKKLSHNFNSTHDQYSLQRHGKWSPFGSEVMALRLKGTTNKEIYISICKKDIQDQKLQLDNS